jgi:hypothetical protein
VIVAHQSGQLRVYDTSGLLILSQQFHSAPIKSLSVRTITKRSHDLDSDEIIILYEDRVIVSVDAAGIWMSLRMFMTQQDDVFSFEPIHLSYKKYLIHEMEEVEGCLSLGTMRCFLEPPQFTGFQMEYAPPQESARFLAIGTPFLGFLSPKDSSDSSIGEQVATKVTHAVSNAFSLAKTLWFQENKVHKDKPSKLKLDYMIDDTNRYPRNISLAPPNGSGDRVYAAITDSLGRVSLMHVTEFLIFKMWKGWRDAQVGWIQTLSEATDSMMLFLVIYSPLSGALEIISVPHGQKILGTHIDKECRLVCSSSDLVGSIHVKDKKHYLMECSLLYPSGELKKVVLAKESLLLARPDQFDLLIKLIKDYKTSMDTVLLKKAVEEVIGYQYLVVQLRALEYFTKETPYELYLNLIQRIVEPALLPSYLHEPSLAHLDDMLEKSTPTDYELLALCQLHFLQVYEKIANLPQDHQELLPWTVHSTDVLAQNHQESISQTPLDYLSFVHAFRPCPPGKFQLIDDMTESKLWHISRFLFDMILFRGICFQDVMDLMCLPHHNWIQLIRNYLCHQSIDRFSEFQIRKLVQIMLELIMPQGELHQQSLETLERFSTTTGYIPVAFLTGFVLRHVGEKIGNSSLQTQMSELMKKSKLLLPSARLLGSFFKVAPLEFGNAETTGIEYMLASYFDQSKDIDEYKIWDDLEETLHIPIHQDVVYVYQAFFELKKWNVHQEVGILV